jgi:hypothetical protein
MTAMSVRKLLTDEGPLYVFYQDGTDLFATPPFKDMATFVNYLTTHNVDDRVTKEQWESYATHAERVYDVRSGTIDNAVGYIAELKQGTTLTDEQACELHEFVKFLDATVGFLDNDYDLVNQQVIEKWIDELELRKLYPNSHDWEDILDDCKSTVYYNAWSKKHERYFLVEETGKATPEQNKLMGFYLSAVCTIANISSPGKNTPAEIVERFVRDSQES